MTHERLKHDLPLSAQVFFVLADELTKTRAVKAWRCIAEGAGDNNGGSFEEAWARLERRASDGERWSTVVPWPEGDRRDLGVLLARKDAAHCLKNIERVRGLPAWSLGGLRFGLDLFNPSGELGLGYPGEGETVVTLLMEREDGGVIRDLASNEEVWRLLRALHRVFEPRRLCGTWSIAGYVLAHSEKRVMERSPWDYMFPLDLLRKPRHISDRERLATGNDGTSTNDSLLLLWPVLLDPKFSKAPMSQLFGRVEVWDEENVVVLVSDGFDGVVRPQYNEAAQVLGMTSIVELIPGAY